MAAAPVPTEQHELLRDPETRKKLHYIVNWINKHPEYATPEGVRSIIEAGAMRVMIQKGMISLPQPTVQQEVLNARRYLDDYCEYVHGHSPRPFHVEWLKALTAPVEKLVIIAPPDHAKTAYVGIDYPSMLVGIDRNTHIGLISNTATQAEKRSVAIRDTIAFNPKYHEVFPHVKPDYGKGWSESEWFVQRDDPGDKDATLRAAGIRGPITGDRYNYIILDDPDDLENTATAYQREKVHEWIEVTLMRRLVPGGRARAIMTRYHHEDTAAYFKAHGWTVIHMPALDEADNALWPERHSAEELISIRAEFPMMFERVYQGRPTPQEGALIKEEWWRYFHPDRIPLILSQAERIIQVLDCAAKDKELNDFSVVMTWALLDGAAYLINIARDKWLYPQLKQATIAQFLRYHPSAVCIESASSGIALFQDLQQTANPALPVYDVKVDRNKGVRLSGVLDYIASHRVYLPVPDLMPWVQDFLIECAQFPLGEHDDQVDCLSMGLRELFQPSALPTWSSPSFLHLGHNIEQTREEVRKRFMEMAAAS